MASFELRDVADEAESIEDTLDAVEAAADSLEAAVGNADGGNAGGPDGWTAAVDPAVAWFDATLRTDIVAVMVADARLELADLDARQESLATRLADLARPAWCDRFGDRLAAFERDVDAVEPPVDWPELQTTLESYRPDGAEA